MSILDVLKQRLAQRGTAGRSGVPGVNDVIRPGDPRYSAQATPPQPYGVPPQYARSVYDKEYSSYNRLEGLRNAGAGYGNDRFYAQGEIYTYDPASQGYRGSISGSVIQQPQGARPPEYEGYNSPVAPVTPEPASTEPSQSAIQQMQQQIERDRQRRYGQGGGQSRPDYMTGGNK